MEITPAAPPPRRDLTVLEAVLPTKLYILPGFRTRTGTPLTFEHGGWRPIRPGEVALFFAHGPCDGGENVMGSKAMVVETWVPSLEVGRVAVADVQDSGAIIFVNHPSGPYIAVTKSRVFLG